MYMAVFFLVSPGVRRLCPVTGETLDWFWSHDRRTASAFYWVRSRDRRLKSAQYRRTPLSPNFDQGVKAAKRGNKKWPGKFEKFIFSILLKSRLHIDAILSKNIA